MDEPSEPHTVTIEVADDATENGGRRQVSAWSINP